MKLRKRLGAAAVALMVIAPAAHARTLNVAVEANTPDIVGADLAYAVREQIARSAEYHLVGNSDEGSYIAIEIASLAVGEAYMPGLETAVSVSFVAPGRYFIGGDVLTCGVKAVPVCAQDILGDLDRLLHSAKP